MKIIGFIIKYFHAIFLSIYLFTIGIFSIKNRRLISAICEHFNYINKPIIPIIPQIEISEIIKENINIQIREPISTGGNISLFELLIISKLVKENNPTKSFEIGTFDGRTTLNIAANSSIDSKIYTLDLPKEKKESTKLSISSSDKVYVDKDVSGSRFLSTKYEKQISQLYGDSGAFDFSPYAGDMEFVFIDGAHSYEYVINDSKLALKMLKNSKGIILWHDYGVWDGVTKALNELYKTNTFKNILHIKDTSLVCLIIK